MGGFVSAHGPVYLTVPPPDPGVPHQHDPAHSSVRWLGQVVGACWRALRPSVNDRRAARAMAMLSPDHAMPPRIDPPDRVSVHRHAGERMAALVIGNEVRVWVGTGAPVRRADVLAAVLRALALWEHGQDRDGADRAVRRAARRMWGLGLPRDVKGDVVPILADWIASREGGA